MSGLFGWFGVPQPQPQPQPQSQPQPQNEQRRIIPTILGIDVTINGNSLYALQGRQIILQTNCKPLTEAELKDWSFRLPIEGLPIGSGYKLIEIGNDIYKVCMKYHTAIDSLGIRMARNPDIQKRYDELDSIFNGAFTRLIKQHDMYNIELVKYLLVEKVSNKNNVSVNGVTYHIDTGVNLVKKIEQQGNVFRSDREGHDITVNLGRLIPILVEGGYNQMSVDDTVPEFESDMREAEIEEASELHNAFDEALRPTETLQKLQQELHQYGDFFNALYSKLPTDGKHDDMALLNMNKNEYGNYLKKLSHVVFKSHLTQQQKTYYNTELKSYYRDKTRRNTLKPGFVFQLRLHLTAASDASLLKYTKILDTVPVINYSYYNESDRRWIDNYINSLNAVYIGRQSYLNGVNIFGDEIGMYLQRINAILDDRSMNIKEKHKQINDLLQKTKKDFLTQLSTLMTNIKKLADNIGPSFGIFSDIDPDVLVNSDDVEHTKQVLDRIRQIILSGRLELDEDLNAIADDPAEGGSRFKQKPKTRKRTKKRTKKRNKSKRHKGYSRRQSTYD
jgi:hypothetical protein